MLTAIILYFRDLIDTIRRGWDSFWFTPIDPATLCMLRILSGMMLLYTHLVWTARFENIFLDNGIVSDSVAAQLNSTRYAWSHFYWIESPGVLWGLHFVALAIFASYTIGWQTRITGVLSFLFTISYINRAHTMLFGLDQINGFLAMYIGLGPAGLCYSVDSWLKRRKGESNPQESIGANISIRLIQLHMSLVYLFAALGKLQGETWWNGEAFWGAAANYEYQTFDISWLAHYPYLVNFLTHATVGWELIYCVLVWPKKFRPLVVFGAIPLHLGIAVAMGMITFGLIMIVGNMAFLSPVIVRRLEAMLFRRPQPSTATS